jgi:hypothetical protein
VIQMSMGGCCPNKNSTNRCSVFLSKETEVDSNLVPTDLVMKRG